MADDQARQVFSPRSGGRPSCPCQKVCPCGFIEGCRHHRIAAPRASGPRTVAIGVPETTISITDRSYFETFALRHQLQVVERSRRPRLHLTGVDRLLWMSLSGIWTEWRQALVLVQPATVVAWHRRGFPAVLDVEERTGHGSAHHPRRCPRADPHDAARRVSRRAHRHPQEGSGVPKNQDLGRNAVTGRDGSPTVGVARCGTFSELSVPPKPPRVANSSGESRSATT